MAKTQHGRDLTAVEMAIMLDEFVNSHNSAKDLTEFTEQVVNRTHRTLQQGIMRYFVATIVAWSEVKNCDARNEATVTMSKKIVAALGDQYDRHLPYV